MRGDDVTKRLYIVRVEIEFAVLAEDEDDAISHTSEAVMDTFLESAADAELISFHKIPGSEKMIPNRPKGWDDTSLVYGADEDTTLGEAIEAERKSQGHD